MKNIKNIKSMKNMKNMKNKKIPTRNLKKILDFSWIYF